MTKLQIACAALALAAFSATYGYWAGETTLGADLKSSRDSLAATSRALAGKSAELAALEGERARLLEENARLKAELETRPCPMPKVGAPGTRARANNNALNVKGRWKDGCLGHDSKGHAVFSCPEYGIRAAAITLLRYQDAYRIRTVEGLIGRFCEGDNGRYVSFVRGRLGVAPGERISVRERLPELVSAMAEYESGCPLPERYLALLGVGFSRYATNAKNAKTATKAVKSKKARRKAGSAAKAKSRAKGKEVAGADKKKAGRKG